MRTFSLPDLGEGLAEAELLEWLVAVGDEVRAGQALARVETDKAQVEIASPWAGQIKRLHVEVGARIHTGGPLVEFELGEEAAHAGSSEDAGTVVGELPVSAPDLGREVRGSTVSSRLRAVPAARARARELGVALDRVVGTGPGGVTTRADVERAVSGDADGAGEFDEPLRGVRLAMARNMARAHVSVVPATLMDEADVEAWWLPELDVTQRLVRAIAVACSVEPALNAGFDDRRLARRLHERVDLAIAIQTNEGLFAPVLRDVADVGAGDLRDGIDRLIETTRTRALRPADLRGATITLSNFGLLGGRYATLVVVPPQVGILGAGRIEPRVVAREGMPVVRCMLPLSLTFDHRAVSGAEAARFLGAARADLERGE